MQKKTSSKNSANKVDSRRKLIVDLVKQHYPNDKDNILLADGYDEAFLGIGCSFGGNNLAIYDRAKCIEILKQKMNPEKAEAYFELNTAAANAGDYTPFFLNTKL